MPDWMHQQLADHRAVAEAGEALLPEVRRVGETLIRAFSGRGVLYTFGNGGSAADAQHLSAELVGRFQKERAALPAVALTVDTSIVTAIANDYSYKQVFARQIEALGQAGDVAFGISTSGAVFVSRAFGKRCGLTHANPTSQRNCGS